MWKEELAKNLDRKKAEITFDPHLFDRKEYWNIDLDKVEETVRIGKIFDEKCEEPNKLCFQRYPKKCYAFLGHQKFYEFFSVLARKTPLIQ